MRKLQGLLNDSHKSHDNWPRAQRISMKGEYAGDYVGEYCRSYQGGY